MGYSGNLFFAGDVCPGLMSSRLMVMPQVSVDQSWHVATRSSVAAPFPFRKSAASVSPGSYPAEEAVASAATALRERIPLRRRTVRTVPGITCGTSPAILHSGSLPILFPQSGVHKADCLRECHGIPPRFPLRWGRRNCPVWCPGNHLCRPM